MGSLGTLAIVIKTAQLARNSLLPLGLLPMPKTSSGFLFGLVGSPASQQKMPLLLVVGAVSDSFVQVAHFPPRFTKNILRNVHD
jgi:hypothetical protein